MSHRYYYLLRPPWLGTTEPDGDILDSERWSPKQEIPEEPHRTAHGWVEYAEPLTPYQAWKYDLLPADEAEKAYLRLWVDSEQDPDKVEGLIDFYLERFGVERLRESADEGNAKAQLVLVLLEDRGEIE